MTNFGSHYLEASAQTNCQLVIAILSAAIITTLSKRRFNTYLVAAGHDTDRALALYPWNAKLAASFILPLQAVEVALRNKVNYALISEFGSEFGPDWWRDRRFRSIIDRERARDLDAVRARIARKGLKLDTDQIVASLSFGFWIGMLQPKYNPPVWGAHLCGSFPDLPAAETRATLFKIGGGIANFRNRISHHEPLLKTDPLRVYGEMMKFLSWLCPDTEKWIRPHCEVPRVVRARP